MDTYLNSYLTRFISTTCYCHGDISQEDSLSCYNSIPTQSLINNNNNHEVSNSETTLQKKIFQRSRLLNCGEDLSFIFQSFNSADVNSSLICHIQVRFLLFLINRIDIN